MIPGWQRLVLIAVLANSFGVSSVFAGLWALDSQGGLFRWAGGDADWEIRGTVPVASPIAISAGLHENDVLVLGSSGDLQRSADGGTTWEPMISPGPGPWTRLSMAPDGAVLALGVHLGRLPFDGHAFHQSTPPKGGVGLGATERGVPLVLDHQAILYRFEDAGLRWAPVSELPLAHAQGLSAFGRVVHASGSQPSLLRSSDGGRSWLAVEAPSVPQPWVMASWPDSLACLGTDGALLLRTRRPGWVPIPALPVEGVVLIAANVSSVVVDRRAFPNLIVAGPSPANRDHGARLVLRVRILGPDTVTILLQTPQGKTVVVRGGEGFPRAGVYSIQWDPGAIPSGRYRLVVRTSSGEREERPWLVTR